MTISILCPNGHKLICPDDRAGKGGKCPHCGATFRVPELSGAAPPPMPSSGSAPKMMVDTPSASKSGPVATIPTPVVVEAKPANPIRPYDEQSDGEPGADEVLFLCPNDHHLIGPTSLAGQAGACPVCQVEFLLPTAEELAEEEADEDVYYEEEPEADVNRLMFNFDGPAVAEEAAPTSVGKLLKQFWRYRRQGAIIELHLSDARVLIPDGFSPGSAARSHGLFVIREANGTQTLLAIAWDSIARIAVRGLRELPNGMKFDFGQ